MVLCEGHCTLYTDAEKSFCPYRAYGSIFLAKAGDEAWCSKYINNMVCET